MRSTIRPGARLRRWGMVVMIVSVTIGAGIMLMVEFQYGEDDFRKLIGLGVMALGAIGVRLHFKGRQLDAKVAADGLRGRFKSSDPHVLYLRSFSADPSGTGHLSTEEEQLGFVLERFGRLLAVGRPGEPLPIPGAARMYTTDEKWRGLVTRRMLSAKLVVIRAGASDGLLWELDRALSKLPPERVLILILGLPLGAYQSFAATAKARSNMTLPPLDPAGLLRHIFWSFKPRVSDAMSGFISFDSEWKPTFSPLPFTLGQTGFNDLRKPFNLALRPMFERHGVPWRPVGRLTRSLNTQI